MSEFQHRLIFSYRISITEINKENYEKSYFIQNNSAVFFTIKF